MAETHSLLGNNLSEEQYDDELSDYPHKDSRYEAPRRVLHVPKLTCCHFIAAAIILCFTFAAGGVAGYYILDLVQLQRERAGYQNSHLGDHSIPRTFEEQPLYSEAPSNSSNALWEKMIPKGRGFVQIKNDDLAAGSAEPGLYCVSVFHQLHCLDMLRHGYYAAIERANLGAAVLHPTPATSSLASDGGPPSPIPDTFSHHSHENALDSVKHDKSHITHCFDYLRQALACASDSTLEKRNETISGVKGWGTTHQCRDFDALMQWTEDHRYSDEQGIMN